MLQTTTFLFILHLLLSTLLCLIPTTSGLDCDDTRECASIAVEDLEGTVSCNGNSACRDALSITALDDVFCNGYFSCHNSDIVQSNDGEIWCSGFLSCGEIESFWTSQQLNCYGYGSCYLEPETNLNLTKISCLGALACNRNGIGGINTIDLLECGGSSGCSYSDITNILDLECDGNFACAGGNISNIGTIDCLGYYACVWSYIDNVEELRCDGYYGCYNAFITKTDNVYGYGYRSLYQSNITSTGNGNEMTIILRGHQAGKNAYIKCNEGDICNLECGGDGCKDIILVGRGEFIIDCDDTKSYCPDYNGSTYVTTTEVFGSEETEFVVSGYNVSEEESMVGTMYETSLDPTYIDGGFDKSCKNDTKFSECLEETFILIIFGILVMLCGLLAACVCYLQYVKIPRYAALLSETETVVAHSLSPMNKRASLGITNPTNLKYTGCSTKDENEMEYNTTVGSNEPGDEQELELGMTVNDTIKYVDHSNKNNNTKGADNKDNDLMDVELAGIEQSKQSKQNKQNKEMSQSAAILSLDTLRSAGGGSSEDLYGTVRTTSEGKVRQLTGDTMIR